MRLPLITTLSLLAFSTSSFAQSDIGFKADGGISSISTWANSNVVTHTNTFMPSGQVGVYYNLHLNHQFSLGTELMFNQFAGNEFVVTNVPSPFGNPMPLYNADNFTAKISYLSIPLYLVHTGKNLGINFGVQFNIRLTGSGEDKGQAYQMPTYVDGNWDNKIDKQAIGSYDYGIRAGLTYKLSDKFMLEANYYTGICSVNYKPQSQSFLQDSEIQNRRTQQITIGLRYMLVTLGKKDESN